MSSGFRLSSLYMPKYVTLWLLLNICTMAASPSLPILVFPPIVTDFNVVFACLCRAENLLKGQSKCSTPTPPNQFPSRLRFCSRTQRNSFAHRDLSLIPVMSRDLTVEFHPKAQATRQEPDMSRWYTRRVLSSGANSTTFELFPLRSALQICTSIDLFLAKTAEISGVAVMDFESKIVSSFRVELTSIIFDNSSAPFDPMESSHICNSSRQ